MSIQHEYDRLCGRRELLILKKKEHGLTPVEMIELESVTSRVDQILAACYPVLEGAPEEENIEAARKRTKAKSAYVPKMIPPVKDEPEK